MAVDEYKNFYAICSHSPVGEHALRVGGTVCFRTSGWSATLEQTEGNTGINPFLLHLDIVMIPPDPATPVQEVITCQELPEWQVAEPAIEYTELEFHVRGSDDPPPPVIPVQHPS